MTTTVELWSRPFRLANRAIGLLRGFLSCVKGRGEIPAFLAGRDLAYWLELGDVCDILFKSKGFPSPHTKQATFFWELNLFT
jgi:hypothetical protein